LKKILLILLFLICFSDLVNAEPFELKDWTVYYGTIDAEITAAWIAASGAESYTVRLYHMETKSYVALGRTISLQITFLLPRTGHYVFEVQATRGQNKSEWAKSDEPAFATVNGEAQGWIIDGIFPSAKTGLSK